MFITNIIITILSLHISTNLVEGLDKCPVNGSTTTGIANNAHIESIKKDIADINNIDTQIGKNTNIIEQLNNELKDVVNIKQKVNDLAGKTQTLQDSVKKLSKKMQNQGYSLVNAPNKNT